MSFHKIVPVKKADKPAPKPVAQKKDRKKPQVKRPVGHR